MPSFLHHPVTSAAALGPSQNETCRLPQVTVLSAHTNPRSLFEKVFESRIAEMRVHYTYSTSTVPLIHA